MSNLIISGGVTLSGGFEAGFGAGGGNPAQTTVLATSLGMYPATNIAGLPNGVSLVHNECVYSVTNGMMNMSYKLVAASNPTENVATYLSGYGYAYRIQLPTGYALDAAQVSGATVVGSGTFDWKNGLGPSNIEVVAIKASQTYPSGSPEGLFWRFEYNGNTEYPSPTRAGFTYDNRIDLQFTATIPVVTV